MAILFSTQYGNLDNLNTLKLRPNGRQSPNDVFKCIFLNENISISIKISQKFVPKGPIDNSPALVQIMAWRRPGDKPLSKTMMISLLTHICVTLSRCVYNNQAVTVTYFLIDGNKYSRGWWNGPLNLLLCGIQIHIFFLTVLEKSMWPVTLAGLLLWVMKITVRQKYHHLMKFSSPVTKEVVILKNSSTTNEDILSLYKYHCMICFSIYHMLLSSFEDLLMQIIYIFTIGCRGCNGK